ncbi:MAG TPA: cytochrome c [Blastocatellia bacterium]
MEEGIHERFTFLSFTLWHDPPMTSEKMEAIAQSAVQLRQLAETIIAHRPRYLEAEWRKDDRKAFDAGAAELSNSAMMLAEAATRKDKTRAENLFNRIEASCQSCHARFNKALANK